jgi:hypothetical protein
MLHFNGIMYIYILFKVLVLLWIYKSQHLNNMIRYYDKTIIAFCCGLYMFLSIHEKYNLTSDFVLVSICFRLVGSIKHVLASSKGYNFILYLQIHTKTLIFHQFSCPNYANYRIVRNGNSLTHSRGCGYHYVSYLIISVLQDLLFVKIYVTWS